MSSTGHAPGWLDLGPGWLFEHIRDAVAVVDLPDGVVRLWNPSAERLFGVEDAEAVGRAIDDLVPGAHAAAAGSLPRTIDLRASKDSTPLEVALSVIDATDGQTFALLVMRDITERRHFEAAER